MFGRKLSRRGFWAGLLVAGAVWFVIGAIVILNRSKDDGDKDGNTTPTQTSATTPTATTPAVASFSQQTAKQVAARAASVETDKQGVTVRPAEWDVKCTARGGGVTASEWTCELGSPSGQCTGTLEVYGSGGARIATRREQVGCGE